MLELNGLSGDAVLKKYTWGQDLSAQTSPARQQGSIPQGAGGIGGLLATHVVSGAKDYLYYYDNLGNVGQMTDHSGTLVATYEYNAYGGVQTKSGSYAGKNPFRFSTKYFDDEAGLGYWVYRYYRPSLGRWLNRDPAGERRDTSLYEFVRNYPTAAFDAIGLQTRGDRQRPNVCDPNQRRRGPDDPPKDFVFDLLLYGPAGDGLVVLDAGFLPGIDACHPGNTRETRKNCRAPPSAADSNPRLSP